MRISVDGRHLAAGRGVSRYAQTLLDGMTAAHGGDDWRVVEAGWAHNAAAGMVARPRLDRLAGGADVAWLPAPVPVALSRDLPYVLTIHDLSWVERPQDYTAYERLWHRVARVRSLARRATVLIAVSEATRGVVAERWGIEEQRIRVVRSGPGLTTINPDRDGAAPRSPPYFLAVGALEPRKDPLLLARAHALARAAGLEAELWFAGSGRLANRLGGDGVRVLGPQDDAALHELYAGATALVHPAVLEGFGFPPIEALAHGIPPIVADLPVHRETVGDGALRFEPGDERGLADAMLRLERDDALRSGIVAAGRAAIARLSWDDAAAQTYAALQDAAR